MSKKREIPIDEVDAGGGGGKKKKKKECPACGCIVVRLKRHWEAKHATTNCCLYEYCGYEGSDVYKHVVKAHPHVDAVYQCCSLRFACESDVWRHEDEEHCSGGEKKRIPSCRSSVYSVAAVAAVTTTSSSSWAAFWERGSSAASTGDGDEDVDERLTDVGPLLGC
jgi:hypothetical protein